MRAAVMREWTLRVDDVPEPTPGPGQVLTKVLACGVCGSDRDLVHHGEEARDLRTAHLHETAFEPAEPIQFSPGSDVVLGHEFCCEVVEVGAGVTNVRAGDRVVSMPLAFDAGGFHTLGFSNHYPGGFGELMVLNELFATRVPGGLPSDVAALSEPLAIGIHAVERAGIQRGDGAVVLGLGTTGLSVVSALRLAGHGPIIGSDPSPQRRELAVQLGCDVVVDPDEELPAERWGLIGRSRPLVVFEASGLPGMIDRAMRMSPRRTRIVVVGACMQRDWIHPLLGVQRELDVRFTLGSDPAEFATALAALADGRVEFGAIVTGHIDIDGIPEAIARPGAADAHVKLLVQPGGAVS